MILQKISRLLFLCLLVYCANGQSGTWEKHKSSLEALSHKINSLEQEIEELVKEKDKSGDPEKTREILETIVQKHKELTEAHTKFREESEHVKYSHPGQGKKFDLKYRHNSVKPLEEFDKKTGMEGLIEEFKQTVDSAYMSPKLQERRDKTFEEKFERENPAGATDEKEKSGSRPKLKL